MKFILLISIFLASTSTYNVLSCDCKSYTLQEEKSFSEFIFIGKVNGVFEDHFTLIFDEIFKKPKEYENTEIRINFNSCSIIPKKNENWLIFAHKRSNQWFSSFCGYSSRIFQWSEKGSSKITPPPPPSMSNSNSLTNSNLYESRVSNQLYFIIQSLRIESLSKKIDSLNNKEISDDFIFHTIMILNTLFFMIVFFKLRKRT